MDGAFQKIPVLEKQGLVESQFVAESRPVGRSTTSEQHDADRVAGNQDVKREECQGQHGPQKRYGDEDSTNDERDHKAQPRAAGSP